MTDYTTFNLQYNTGTDASPVFTGTAIAFGGTSGANEIRWAASGAGAGGTASASWPYYTRPGSVTGVAEMWAFTADTTGSKVATYNGGPAASLNNLVLRWNWDNVGTFAAAPQFGAFGDTTHTTPSAGTQPGGQSGSPIINGQSTDTSSTSYLKANAFGYGVDTLGAQQTPPASGGGGGTDIRTSTLAATSGTAGAVSPATGAWLTTFQSLQGFVQYILDAVIPKATTAGFWYWVPVLWTGPNMSTGTLLPTVTMQYSFA